MPDRSWDCRWVGSCSRAVPGGDLGTWGNVGHPRLRMRSPRPPQLDACAPGPSGGGTILRGATRCFKMEWYVQR